MNTEVIIHRLLETLHMNAGHIDSTPNPYFSGIAGWRSRGYKPACQLYKLIDNLTVEQLDLAVNCCNVMVKSYIDNGAGHSDNWYSMLNGFSVAAHALKKDNPAPVLVIPPTEDKIVSELHTVLFEKDDEKEAVFTTNAGGEVADSVARAMAEVVDEDRYDRIIIERTVVYEVSRWNGRVL